MKKRLRKKKYVGEFQVQQWRINCRFQADITEDAVNEVKEKFSEMANSYGFAAFRAGDTDSYSFILDGTRCYKTPTEAQRQTLTEYLQSLPAVLSTQDKGLGYL